MSSKQSVQCIMCPKIIKIRLIANHLQNIHKIEHKSVLSFSKLQLGGHEKLNKVLKKKEKKSTCQRIKEKRHSQRTNLLNKFETCIQNQYLNEDIFSKLLLDVSMKFHQNRQRIMNKPMGYDDSHHKDVKKDETIENDKNISLIINLKEKRVVTKQEKDYLNKSKACGKIDKSNAKKHRAREPKNLKPATSTPKTRARKPKNHTNATSRTRGG